MRILIVTDAHAQAGGGERYVQWLRGSLETQGHGTRLLLGGPDASRSEAEYAAFAPRTVGARALTQIFNPFAAAGVRSALRQFRPDAVLLLGFLDELSPAVLSPLRGVATVASIIDYKIICPIARKLLPDQSICTNLPGAICWRGGCVGALHWMRDQPRYRSATLGFRRIDRVLACSEWMKDVLAANGIEAEALLLPVPAPSTEFRRQPAPEPQFLFLGRLCAEKGVDALLRAFHRVRQQHPTATLQVGGEGAEHRRLVQLTNELGLREAVTFSGWLEPAAIEAALACAWALVAPSVWAEPLGLVAVEANIRGVPVIASRVGGFAETVEPGAGGILVPNGDVNALASAMLDIASRRVFADQRVTAEVARRVAERHDLAEHTRKLVGILERARPAA